METVPTPRKVPRWIRGLVALGLFAAALAGEALLRESRNTPLQGRPEGGPWPLRVEGRVGPDFLWLGERWSLTITNEGTVALPGCTFTFEDDLVFDTAAPTFTLLPGGSTTLCWNHDHANAPRRVPTRLRLHALAGTFEWRIERRR